MFDKFEHLISSKKFKRITDPSNIGLYLFGFIVVMVSWSGLKTIQQNYKLQQKIAGLEAQNELAKLENQNSELRNKFYETSEYLDLAVRRQFGKAEPGEKLIIVPKEVALSKVAPYKQADIKTVTNDKSSEDSKYISNIRAWREFVSGQNN